MRILISCSLILALAGCSGDSMPDISTPKFLKRGAQAPTAPAASDALRPVPRPGSEGEPDGTLGEPELVDGGTSIVVSPTTSAVAAPQSGELGTTIASLGDPTVDGFWLKTPLVAVATSGRVVYAQTGRSVRVELLPSGGAVGSGSQISLAAIRLLEAPLADLIEVTVYIN